MPAATFSAALAGTGHLTGWLAFVPDRMAAPTVVAEDGAIEVSFVPFGGTSTIEYEVEADLVATLTPHISVRELPPLRQSYEILTPKGRRYRWAEDEPAAPDVPSGVRHSSTMPGGHENFDAVLPRRPEVDYDDLEIGARIRVHDAGGEIVGEYRLSGVPQTSGDQVSVSPAATGYQAELNDNQNASLLVIDRDLSAWQDASRQEQLNWAALNFGYQNGATVLSDREAGTPALHLAVTGAWTATTRAAAESFYDAGPGLTVAEILFQWTDASINAADTNWVWQLGFADDDALVGDSELSANLRAAGSSDPDSTFDATTPRRFALMRLYYLLSGAAGTDGREYAIDWPELALIGDHGLTRVDDGLGGGYYTSDVAALIVSRFAPSARYVMGETVLPSQFILPHAVWRDTTGGEMLTNVARYNLEDWAFWEGPTFYWAPRNYFGRRWRARIGPANLSATGPQIDRLWNSVVVQYTDVSGATYTVGPPGSGCDFTDSVLADSDPDNGATAAGLNRRQRLQMGTSTAAAAIEVGRRFLEESQALDRSGQAVLTGFVEDTFGALYPYSRVRAGDSIEFIDAADPSPRRIVRVEHDRATRACTVDLDAPPEGLQALLDRLQVVLVPLGIMG